MLLFVEALVIGTLIGLALAAPVGPMALLVVERTLRQGWPYGVITGVGVALADGVYGLIAVIGWKAVADTTADYRFLLQGTGGLILLGLGIHAFRQAAPVTGPAPMAGRPSVTLAIGSAFVLTLANPLTAAAFAAVIAGAGPLIDRSGATPLLTGVILGSFAWWCLLVVMAAATGHRLPAGATVVIGRFAGVALGLFGLYALGELFMVSAVAG